MSFRAAVQFAIMAGSALLLSGCIGSRATIQSTKMPFSTESLKQLMVVEKFAPNMSFKLIINAPKEFEDKFSGALRTCGIGTAFQEVDPRPNTTEHVVVGKGVDGLMIMQWTMQRTGGYAPPLAVYTATLLETKSLRPVWMARINLTAQWYSGDRLAAALVDKLKQDSIIPSYCVTPEVPQTPF